MDRWSRRRILAAGVSVGLSAFAGCSGSRHDERPTDSRTETTAETTTGTTAIESAATETTATPQTPFSTGVFTVETVASRLRVPWDLAFTPDGTCYFTERPGRINVLASVDEVTTLAELPETVAQPGRECGLLGIAVHPAYPEPPWVYVYQTYRAERLYNRILRFERNGGDGRLKRRGTVVDRIPGELRHDGGRIGFGPDGKLYVTTGDATQSNLAEDLASRAGKTLRYDVDGSIPADNPFPNSPVWTYGHRNPQGLAWHPRTGQPYVTEHGESGHDEINRLLAGKNYGWPAVEGTAEDSAFVDPVLESGERSWAPSGATFYGGDAFLEWRDSLFFTTLGYGPGEGRRSLHRVGFARDGRTVEAHDILLTEQFGRIRAVAEAPDGTLYFTISNRDGRDNPAPIDDRIFRIRPTDR